MAKPRSIPGVVPGTPLIAFLRRLILSRHRDMMAHHEVAVTGDPDAIHDMRVGSRRLRAALLLGRGIFTPRRRFTRLERSIRDLTDALGNVRDMDVLRFYLEDDLEGAPMSDRPHLKRLIAHVDGRRTERQEQMNRALRGFGRPRPLLRFVSFFREGPDRVED